MITTFVRTIAAALALAMVAAFTIPASAATTGGWVDKQYDIQGTWSIEQDSGKSYIVFADDFRTKGGPDLKVFLSPKSADAVTGRTATMDSILLGKLESMSGEQRYEIPAAVNLDDFQSVLVHCQQYAVLWGAGSLTN